MAYLLSFVDRFLMTLLVVPMEHDLGLSDVQLSLVQGAGFAVFYVLFAFPIARLVDRGNRRSIIAAGIAGWSVATALCGVASNFWMLLAARIGVGGGEATLVPGATSLLADLFPPRRRGVALGFFAAGIYIGSAGALIIGGLLLRVFTARPPVLPLLGAVHPWQAVFLTLGLPGLLLAAAMLAGREPSRRRDLHMAAHASVADVVAFYRSEPVATLCHHLGFTFIAFASYAGIAWLPTIFIRVHGWSGAQIGTRLGAVVLVAGPVGSLLGGWLADRMQAQGVSAGRFRVGMTAACALMVPGVLFPLVPQAGLALALAGVFILCTSTVWGLSLGALQDIVPSQMLGQSAAIYSAVINLIGLGLGPLSVALLARAAFHGQAALADATAVMTPLAGIIAATSFWFGSTAYARARARLAVSVTRPAAGALR